MALSGDHGAPSSDAGVAVALYGAFDHEEQVDPYRLGTGIAAPCAPDDRCQQEKAEACHDQEPGHKIELLRPYLDREDIEPPVGGRSSRTA